MRLDMYRLDNTNILDMPRMIIYPTMYCNLKCPYCGIGKRFNNDIKDNKFEGFLANPKLHQILKESSPINIHCSGGEPLSAPNLKEFILQYGELGHKFSFNSNLSLPFKQIKEVFSSIPKDYLGFCIAAHHFLCGVPQEKILDHCKYLRDIGIRVYLLYLLIPGEFTRISEYLENVHEEGFSAFTAHLSGEYAGKHYPEDYTIEEAIQAMDLITVKTAIPPLFGGIVNNDYPCRSGQDIVDWAHWIITEPNHVGRCCISYSKPISIDETFFITGKRTEKICHMKYCSAGNYISKYSSGNDQYGDDRKSLLDGTARPMGINKAMEFLRQIRSDGYKLINEEKFFMVEKYLKNKPDYGRTSDV